MKTFKDYIAEEPLSERKRGPKVSPIPHQMVWHSSDQPYGEGRPFRHYGTKKAAAEVGGKYLYGGYLDIQNPLLYDGPAQNNSVFFEFIIKTAYKEELISRKEKNKALLGIHASAFKRWDGGHLITDLMDVMGYDGIVYTNQEQDRGSISWMALRAEQFELVES